MKDEGEVSLSFLLCIMDVTPTLKALPIRWDNPVHYAYTVYLAFTERWLYFIPSLSHLSRRQPKSSPEWYSRSPSRFLLGWQRRLRVKDEALFHTFSTWTGNNGKSRFVFWDNERYDIVDRDSLGREEWLSHQNKWSYTWYTLLQVGCQLVLAAPGNTSLLIYSLSFGAS